MYLTLGFSSNSYFGPTEDLAPFPQSRSYLPYPAFCVQKVELRSDPSHANVHQYR